LVYICLPWQTEGKEIEVAHTAAGPASTDQARDLGRALAPWLDGAGSDAGPLLPNLGGTGAVRLVVVPIGCGRQDGVLVAGSRQNSSGAAPRSTRAGRRSTKTAARSPAKPFRWRSPCARAGPVPTWSWASASRPVS